MQSILLVSLNNKEKPCITTIVRRAFLYVRRTVYMRYKWWKHSFESRLLGNMDLIASNCIVQERIAASFSILLSPLRVSATTYLFLRVDVYQQRISKRADSIIQLINTVPVIIQDQGIVDAYADE